MNKQMVNLIGALACTAILGLGVAVFALPLFSAAGTTAASAADVAAQNATQQTVLDALTVQSADMTELNDDVAELRAEIPEAAHLDDVLLLAVQAAEQNGGTVTSLIPATAEAFAPRVTTAGEPGTPAPSEPEPATEPSPAADDGSEEPAADAPVDPAAAAAAEAAAAAAAAQQIAVTVVIEAPDVPAATRIVDALRDGPRLVAVTQAAVTTPTEGGATLTVTLLAFSRP